MNKVSLTSLAKKLRELDSFIYYPNPGNCGDALIVASTLDYFHREQLSFKEFSGEFPQQPFNLVYGGGGRLVKEWITKEVYNIFSSPYMNRCFILAHSIRECNEFISRLDERFTLILREEQSYNYCKENAPQGVTCVFMDDMALSGEIDHLLTPQLPLSLNLAYNVYLDYLQNLLNLHLQIYHGEKILLCLRTDAESAQPDLSTHLSHNLDLSLSFFDSITTVQESLFYTGGFLQTLNKVDVIITDRLHIAIGGSLLHKKVYLLDNSYGKCQGIYKASLQSRFPHTHLITNKEIKFPFENNFLENFPYFPICQVGYKPTAIHTWAIIQKIKTNILHKRAKRLIRQSFTQQKQCPTL